MNTETLQQILSKLDTLTNWEHRARSTMKMTLDPMRDLMTRLGNPHIGFRAIHITGTKGKGSVGALLEVALLKAGLSVGRYASPHLEQVNERVSLQCSPISNEALSNSLALALDALEDARSAGSPGEHASWFDVFTAAAFLAFKKAEIDVAVVEVGIGGLKDSTNVISSDVAVVTNVELEHTEVLGATRAAIAQEKIGILKPRTHLVTTLLPTDEAGMVLHDSACAMACSVDVISMITGEHLEDINVRVAGAVLDYLGQKKGFRVSSNPIRSQLIDRYVREAARLPGRMERFQIWVGNEKLVTVVMDGAHVPFNLSAVLRELNRDVELAGPCIAVVGIGRDKDAESLLAVLLESVSYCISTDLPGPSRGVPCDDLKRIAQSVGARAEAQPVIAVAVDLAMATASAESGWVLITGSLYLAGAARALPEFRRV
ncbi:Mur ligase family protein [Caballeronia sp. LP006]|uniref:bifunctional folylpolyglutamate synthase/dihydrofolate synthase n=1 Tax=Caballeronia sp. LP006 TaxID=3038552 RepID=UPI002859FCE1|nr:Mur ligase family protein [Caballeronia sp. LP006]MDR5832320.1 Mur ligase family protein [Caballeronia sp. LP006]